MLEKQIWVKKLNYLTQFLDNNELDNRAQLFKGRLALTQG